MKKRRSLWFKIGIAATGLLLLCLAAYFVVGTAWFFRTVALPRLEGALNASIKAEAISFQPLGSVTLTGVTLDTTDEEPPLLTADRLRLRYDLWAIISGTWAFDEIVLQDPHLRIIERPDGSSNLDPLFGAGDKSQQQGREQLPHVAIGRLVVSDGLIRRINFEWGGRGSTGRIENLHLMATNLALGSTGMVRFRGKALFIENPPGSTANTPAGQTRAPVTLAFGSTNTIGIGEQGRAAQIQGVIHADELSLADGRASQSANSSNLHLVATYQASLNLATDQLHADDLALLLRRGDDPLAKLRLTAPATLDWSGVQPSLSGGTLQGTVDSLPLSEWNPLLDADLPSGLLTLKATLSRGKGGRGTQIDLGGFVRDFSSDLAGVSVGCDQVEFRASGELLKLKELRLDSFIVEVQEQGNAVLTTTGSVVYALGAGGRLEAQLRGSLPALVNEPRLTDASIDTGRLLGDLTWQTGRATSSVSGSIAVRDFNGKIWGLPLADYSAVLEMSATRKGTVLRSEQAVLKLMKSGALAGQLLVDGRYDLSDRTGVVSGSIERLNELALKPFFQAVFSRRELQSILAEGSGRIEFGSPQGLHFSTDLALDQWRMADREGNAFEPPPVTLAVAGTLAGPILALETFRLDLSPTERATNQLRGEGRLDLAHPGGWSGRLDLSAEALNLTPYYDLLVADEPARAPGEPALQEPSAVSLPCAELNVTLEAERIRWRTARADNVQLQATLRSNVIDVSTLTMNLNDGSVSAYGAVDVGVPGFAYDFSATMTGVELPPILRALSRDPPLVERGRLFGHASLEGAGITGASLQHTLRGSAWLLLTNMQYQVFGPNTSGLIAPVVELLDVPELLHSPIRWASLSIHMDGDGVAEIGNLAIHSTAFHAAGRGTMPISDVITNSPLNLPMDFLLRHSLARQAGVLVEKLSRRGAYVELPPFLAIQGTFGSPAMDVDRWALAGLIFQGAVPIPGVGGLGQEVLEGIGDIFGDDEGPSPPEPRGRPREEPRDR